MPRKYDLGQRASAMAATREKVLRATIALHAEQGIVATSYKDIARRADVGVGTVYYHFPALDDLVLACGSRLIEITKPPDPSMLDGLRSRRSRIEKMVVEIFAWYQRYPAWRRALCDADKLDVLARAVNRREAILRQFVAAALGPETDDQTVTLVRAMVDFEVYRNLVDGGTELVAAARGTAAIIARGLRA